MALDPDDPDVQESAYLSWLAFLSPAERTTVDALAESLARRLLALILYERDVRPTLSFGVWVHALNYLYMDLEDRIDDDPTPP